MLYISRATRTPEAPGNEPQLRRRQRDSALAAWERPKQFQDHKQARWQDILDSDHKHHAVQRLAKIYDDPQHFIHQKAPRHQGKRAKQYKRELVKQCGKSWAENHHRWEPHRSGYQCTACGARVHQGLTKSILETRLHEDCPQVRIEDAYSLPAKAEPLAKKLTRAQVIKDLLHRQQQQTPAHDEHQYAETTGYLKCLKCGVNTRKRVNEEAFQHFITSKCVDQAFPQPPQGRPSHTLWQKGEKVRCTQCGCQWNLDGEQRIITNQVLTKVCKGAGTKGSPPLSEFFRKKTDTSSQSAEASLSQPPAKEAQSLDVQGPTPRRLHFNTQLDEREGQEDEEGEGNNMIVDFF